MKKSLGMNKDDFMKLFISQLKYQDPLKPQDPSAMLDQLSQLTLVEQSYNNTTALNNLLAAQNNSNAMAAVSYIGKTVTANGSSIAFDGSAPASLKYNFTAPTDATQITISDSTGKTVRTISNGASATGDSSITWDGRDSSGAVLPAGSYKFTVSGTKTDGTTVTATSYLSGKVDGVSMVDGKPMLTIGATSVALADVISVKGA